MEELSASLSRSTVTWRQLLTWFMVIPLALVASSIPAAIVDYIVNASVHPFQPDPAIPNWGDGISAVFSAITFGTTSAALIGRSWRRLVQGRSSRWALINSLVMSVGFLLTLLALSTIDPPVPEGGFRLWHLLPIASMGIVIGVIQWGYLRLWALSARGWIVVMSFSWLLFWLLVVVIFSLIGT